MNFANLALLQAKMTGENPFIAEVRNGLKPVIWVSDKRGTFELELIVTGEDDWTRIQFSHEGTEFEGDVNVFHKDNGEPCVCVYAVANCRTIGTDFVNVPLTINTEVTNG